MTQLKIVSWNIWGGKNLPEIINVLKKENADIVCLQEVLAEEDGGNNNAEVIALTLGYEWRYQSTTLLTPSVSYLLKEQGIEDNKQWGNAILSKYPVLRHDVHTLSENHKRIALEAIVNIAGSDIHIISTHLAHTNHSPSEIQINQAENLLKISTKEFSIIAGDFNSTPETEVFQKMEEAMVNTQNTYSNNSYTYTSNSSGVKSVIDYIFCTKGGGVISSGVVNSKASDHLPIYSIIEI